MQLRNANNEVTMQVSTITDDNGNILLSQNSSGELVFNRGILTSHQDTPAKLVSVNGQGIQFLDGVGNSQTISNPVRESDNFFELPLVSGTFAIDPTP